MNKNTAKWVFVGFTIR